MINPAELEDILEVLREHNVASFTCPEFSVSLLPAAPAAEGTDVSAAIKEGNEIAQGKSPGPRGAFSHPSLWPNGTAPTFRQGDV